MTEETRKRHRADESDEEWREESADEFGNDQESSSQVENEVFANDTKAVFLERIHSLVDPISQKLAQELNQDSAADDSPRGFTGKLKDYQVVGYRWLKCLYESNINGILADEMGLGKTIQAIAFSLHLKHSSHFTGPILIVLPLSVQQNWFEELKRFAPELNTLIYTGTKEERQVAQQQLLDKSSRPDVVLVTYEMCNKDIDFLRKTNWSYLIVDEAHRLKNRLSLLYGNLLSLGIGKSLLMTGTPVQNNLEELNALLRFQNPHLFHSDPKQFVSWFQKKTDLTELRQLLSCFILRREKEIVIKDLPDKKEFLFYCGISDVQQKLYKSILCKDLAAFKDAKRSTTLNNILMQLRKCVDHPYLFPGVEPEPFKIGDHIVKASGKLWLLDHLLSYLKAKNHRVLLFSQFTSMLDIIQDYLDWRELSYVRLDGSVRGCDRITAIQEFTGASKADADQDDVFVFLLSTRAGGVGLNLTQADTVIFYDSDFNPQMDLQAAARAHRIGQSKQVNIIRLVSRGTVEDIILKRALLKRQMTENLLKTGAFSHQQHSETEDSMSDVTSQPQNLAAMLKYGLDEMTKDESGTIVEADLDQVLTLHAEPSAKESAPGAALVEQMELEPAPENMYIYAGEDYSKLARQSDLDAFEKLAISERDRLETSQDLGRVSRTEKSPSETYEEFYQRLHRQEQEQRVERQRRREEALRQLWTDNQYTSLKIENSDAHTVPRSDSGGTSDDDFQIRHVTGNILQPISSDAPGIIVHCVDTSGSWTRRGIFGQIQQRWPHVADAYEKAGEMKDLHLGDVHLIPLDSPAQSVNTMSTQAPRLFMALCVAYTKHTRGPPALNSRALENSLETLLKHAHQNQYIIHSPRFGDRDTWYSVERVYLKWLRHWPTKLFVYYFYRPQASRYPYPAPASSTRIQPGLHDSDGDDEEESEEEEQTSNDLSDSGMETGSSDAETIEMGESDQEEEAETPGAVMSATATNPLTVTEQELPRIFTGITIQFLNYDPASVMIREITRYFVAHDGQVTTDMARAPTYYISLGDLDLKNREEDNELDSIQPSVPVVRYQWLVDCLERRQLITDLQPYLIFHQS